MAKSPWKSPFASSVTLKWIHQYRLKQEMMESVAAMWRSKLGVLVGGRGKMAASDPRTTGNHLKRPEMISNWAGGMFTNLAIFRVLKQPLERTFRISFLTIYVYIYMYMFYVKFIYLCIYI